jgi:glutathione S-transferase
LTARRWLGPLGIEYPPDPSSEVAGAAILFREVEELWQTVTDVEHAVLPLHVQLWTKPVAGFAERIMIFLFLGLGRCGRPRVFAAARCVINQRNPKFERWRLSTMPKITLYIQPSFQLPGRARCFSGTPFAIKIARLLQYKGLGFEVDEVGWIEREKRLPELSASRKLPVLDYDGERIEDSTEIAHFIEARHPTPALVPTTPVLRARCHFLEEWADEVLYWYGIYEQRRISSPALVESAYFADLPEAVRQHAAERLRANVDENLSRQGIGRYPIEKVQRDVRRGLDALTCLIEADGYVAGPALSLADVALFGQFHRRMAGTNPWLEAEIEERPAIAEWLPRIDVLTGLPEASRV